MAGYETETSNLAVFCAVCKKRPDKIAFETKDYMSGRVLVVFCHGAIDKISVPASVNFPVTIEAFKEEKERRERAIKVSAVRSRHIQRGKARRTAVRNGWRFV